MVLKAFPVAQLSPLLRQRLARATNLAVLGVGSELRGDDAVGMRVAALLDESARAHPKLRVHFGSTAPESATGPIRVQQPSHLIIVDAAGLRATPGEVALLEPSALDGITFCTHALPLTVVIDFIRSSNPGLDVFVLAIQAEHMEFGAPLSERVEATAQALTQQLLEAANWVLDPETR